MNLIHRFILIGLMFVISSGCTERLYEKPKESNNETISKNAPLKCEVVKETVTPYTDDEDILPGLRSGPEGYLEFSNTYLLGGDPELFLVNKDGEKTVSLGSYNLLKISVTPAPGGFYLYQQEYDQENHYRTMLREVVLQNGDRSGMEDLTEAIIPNFSGPDKSYSIQIAGMSEDGSQILFDRPYGEIGLEEGEHLHALWMVNFDENHQPLGYTDVGNLNPDQEVLWTTLRDRPGYGVVTDDENFGIDFNYHYKVGLNWRETKTFIALPDDDEWSWDEYLKVINWQDQPALVYVHAAAREPNYYSVVEDAFLTKIDPYITEPYQGMKLPPIMDVEALGDVLVGVTTDEVGNPKDVVLIEEDETVHVIHHLPGFGDLMSDYWSTYILKVDDRTFAIEADYWQWTTSETGYSYAQTVTFFQCH